MARVSFRWQRRKWGRRTSRGFREVRSKSLAPRTLDFHFRSLTISDDASALVDAFWLMILRLTLGGEKRLFAEGTITAAFKVTESTVTSKGVVIVHYEQAGRRSPNLESRQTHDQSLLRRRRFPQSQLGQANAGGQSVTS
jgi:hypothetical protein